MNFWEATKSLEEGKKVRKVYWEEDNYIYLNHNNDIVNNYGDIVDLYYIPYEDEWKIYKDRKPAPTILKK